VTELVPHYCPTHGKVLDTLPTALVYCGQGDKEHFAAPKGVEVGAHKRAYLERARARLAMRRLRNNRTVKPLPQAKSKTNEPLNAPPAVSVDLA
jgi:hypothetical protein